MTDFLCEYLYKEKITLYGHSWGSLLAANLALDDPEQYDALIVSSLVVDEALSRQSFYLIEGSKDHGVSNMVEVAADYFETVDAPDKEMIYADGGHG